MMASPSSGAPEPGRAPSLVSVIIPALNAANVISEQLDALANQDYAGAWEVVVVDNGSSDATRDVVASRADRLPALQIVDASVRRGHTVARNAGARAAKGDFLAYCDADDVAVPQWLTALIREAPTSHLVGGYIDDGPLNSDRNRDWRRTQAADRLPTKMGFLPLALSANLGIWSSVLADIGGWNESYAEGCNDVELCWRAQVAGYKLSFAPDAVMAYRYRDSLRGLARQMYRRGLAEPKLYRDFLPYGLPRRSPFEMAVGWAKLVGTLPEVFAGPPRRGRWIRRAALSSGRIRGSIQHRTLYL